METSCSCRDFDEGAYAQSVLQQLKERFTTVFAAAFLPVHASRDGNSLLAAAYSTGYIRIFDWRDMSKSWMSSRLSEAPCCMWRAHERAVYHLACVGQGESGLLVSCGDDGYVRGWHLGDIANAAAKHKEQHQHHQQQQQQHHRREPRLLAFTSKPVFEVCMAPAVSSFDVGVGQRPAAQYLAVDEQQGRLFVGSSDGGCHALDVQRLSSASGTSVSSVTALEGHLAGVLGMDVCAATKQLASASEDGTVRVFDLRANNTPTAIIDPWNGVLLKPRASKLEQLKCVESSYVSCVRFDPGGSWMIAGNGTASLTLWSNSLNALAKQQSTDGCVPQALHTRPGEILMVGTQPALHRYRFSLEPIKKSEVSAPSAFGLDIEPGSGTVVVCGLYGCLDLLSQHGVTIGHAAPAVVGATGVLQEQA